MTVSVRAAAAKSTVPVIVACVATFMLLAVMPPLRVSTPPVASVGVAKPPRLSNTTPASELAPTSVRLEPPSSVGVIVGAIWPALVSIVRLELWSDSPPAGITTVPAAPPSTTCAAFKTVPPV